MEGGNGVRVRRRGAWRARGGGGAVVFTESVLFPSFLITNSPAAKRSFGTRGKRLEFLFH